LLKESEPTRSRKLEPCEEVTRRERAPQRTQRIEKGSLSKLVDAVRKKEPPDK
jgi:hypothetical protein